MPDDVLASLMTRTKPASTWGRTRVSERYPSGARA